MRRQAGERHLWNTGFHFGDWLAFATTASDYPGATTGKDLIATAFYAALDGPPQRAAAVLGKREDEGNTLSSSRRSRTPSSASS